MTLRGPSEMTAEDHRLLQTRAYLVWRSHALRIEEEGSGYG